MQTHVWDWTTEQWFASAEKQTKYVTRKFVHLLTITKTGEEKKKTVFFTTFGNWQCLHQLKLRNAEDSCQENNVRSDWLLFNSIVQYLTIYRLQARGFVSVGSTINL